MKKAIALCLTAAMAASLLTGCGSKTTETTAAAENKTETTAGAVSSDVFSSSVVLSHLQPVVKIRSAAAIIKHIIISI